MGFNNNRTIETLFAHEESSSEQFKLSRLARNFTANSFRNPRSRVVIEHFARTTTADTRSRQTVDQVAMQLKLTVLRNDLVRKGVPSADIWFIPPAPQIMIRRKGEIDLSIEAFGLPRFPQPVQALTPISGPDGLSIPIDPGMSLDPEKALVETEFEVSVETESRNYFYAASATLLMGHHGPKEVGGELSALRARIVRELPRSSPIREVRIVIKVGLQLDQTQRDNYHALGLLGGSFKTSLIADLQLPGIKKVPIEIWAGSKIDTKGELEHQAGAMVKVFEF